MKVDPAEVRSRATRAMPETTVPGPVSVRTPVRERREEIDWDAVLPPRAGTRRWRIAKRVKRVIDVVGATAALVVLSPVFLLAAILVRLSGSGPIIYRWDAVGRRGRRFVGYKFRTMIPDAETLKPEILEHNEMRNGPVFKMKDDPRVTRIGRWLRRLSVDELPQLFNVLKGDMSLVGPRPPLPEEYERFEPWQRGKLTVTPGITCLWQVGGRNEIADFHDWVALDLEYIRRWSLLLDLKILLRTIPAVIRGRGAY